MCKDDVVKSVALTDSSAVCCGSCKQFLPVNFIFTPCGGHPICGKCLASLISGWVRCSYTEDCRIAFFSQAGMVKCYDPGCTHSYSPSNLLHAVPKEVFAAYEGGVARAVKWMLKEENLSLIFNNVDSKKVSNLCQNQMELVQKAFSNNLNYGFVSLPSPLPEAASSTSNQRKRQADELVVCDEYDEVLNHKKKFPRTLSSEGPRKKSGWVEWEEAQLRIALVLSELEAEERGEI
jgi:hypothetical protein